jgi:hypothetical protein
MAAAYLPPNQEKINTCANLLTGTNNHANFMGGQNFKELHSYAMKPAIHQLSQRCKRLVPLLAAPAALLLGQGQAKAVLTYNIFQSGNDVVIQASGSLNLANPKGPTYRCGRNGLLISSLAVICTGNDNPVPGTNLYYDITGPASFGGNGTYDPASSTTGIFTILWGEARAPQGGIFSIDNTYMNGSTISATATFSNTTLSALDFTQPAGLIGTWSLVDSGDSIEVYLERQSSTVPGPLPLLGAGAAFGWSRRLRKRIATPMITQPQA